MDSKPIKNYILDVRSAHDSDASTTNRDKSSRHMNQSSTNNSPTKKRGKSNSFDIEAQDVSAFIAYRLID